MYGDYEPAATVAKLDQLLSTEPELNAGSVPAAIASEPLSEELPALTTLSTENIGDEAFALVWQGPDMTALAADGPVMDSFNALLLGNEGRGGRLANVLGDLGIDPENSLKFVQRSFIGRGYWAVIVQTPEGRLGEVTEAIKQDIALLVRSLTSSTAEHQEALSAEEISAAQALSKNARTLALEDQGKASLFHAHAILNGNELAEVLSYQAQLSEVSRSDLARIANTYFAADPIIFQLANPSQEPEPTSPEAKPEVTEPAATNVEKSAPPEVANPETDNSPPPPTETAPNE